MTKKFKKDDFQNLPDSAVEFIKLIIKRMKYRRKVRQDVQAELIAHFEDELKDCASDEEKTQKARKLTAEFGDVEVLAVLLRRAKKRCRPLWRTFIARIFQIFVVLILCLAVYLVWFFTGKPVVSIDYLAEFNQIVKPSVDESLNAAPFYNEAAAQYEQLSEDNKELFDLLSKKPGEVTQEQKQLIEKWLSDKEDILELVIAGSKKPYYWSEYVNKNKSNGMIGVLMPHLSEFRRLARSLLWRAQLRAEKGRYEDAFSDIKYCYLFGQHLRGNKTLIEQLVGMAIEALSVQTIRDIISEYKIEPAMLAALQKDFEQIAANEDFSVSLKAEKLFIDDEIQRCFTEDCLGGGHLYFPRISSLASVSGLNSYEFLSSPLILTQVAYAIFLHPNKEETRETVESFYSFWEKIITESPGELRAKGINFEKEGTKIIKGNLFLEIMAPAFDRINEISYRSKTDVQATLLTIAILRYRQDKDAYPEKLAELVTADYIKEIPTDPFSDRPLIYKKTGDEFTLYSVGFNFTDDDGQIGKDSKGKPKLWTNNGDAVFWPIPKSETNE
jgi:dsDNA-binding SOS-regulon protein